MQVRTTGVRSGVAELLLEVSASPKVHSEDSTCRASGEIAGGGDIRGKDAVRIYPEQALE